MNVLIIELGGSHIECIYTFVHALKLKNATTHLCCNQKLIPLFPEQERPTGILEMPNEFDFFSQIRSFFKIRKYIQKNKITHVVINTCELKIIRNLFFFLPASINFTGQVHHAKKLEKSVTFTKILSRKMRKYFVLGDHLLHNIKAYAAFRVASIYPIYFPKIKSEVLHKKSGECWIAIPGGVAMERRDYLPLIDAIRNGNLEDGIVFIFLGRYYLDPHVNPEWKKEDWWKKHIIHFEEEVPYDLFHEYLSKSDVILPLIKMHGDSMYGDGRISGSFNLGLGYQKAMLLPETYRRNEDLIPFSLYYNDMDGLMKMIQTIKEDIRVLDTIKSEYAKSEFNNWNLMSDKIVKFIAS